MENQQNPLQTTSPLFTQHPKKPKGKLIKDKNKCYNAFFIGLFFLCSSAFLINIFSIKALGLALPSSNLGISPVEVKGRTYAVKWLEELPLIGKFFSGEIQKEIEKGVRVYFAPREQVLLANYELNNAMNEKLYQLALPKQQLVPLDDGQKIRFLDKNHNIMINLSPMDESYMTNSMHKSIEFFNHLYQVIGNDTRLMIYGVTTPYHVPELNKEYTVIGYNATGYTYLETFKKQLDPNIHFKTLDLQTMKEYSTLFYATDHHWNMYGAYQGYQDIMTMLGRADEIRKVEIEPLEGVKFRGSIARLSANDSLYEAFLVPKVDLGEYEVVINNNPNSGTKLNNRDTLLEKSKTNKFLSCYSEYFREDFATVTYDFKQPSEKNLLIIGDSMTNSVENLIASHYNKTHVVDLRLYEQKYGSVLDVVAFIKENKIGDVLFLTQSQGCLIDNSSNIIVQ